MSRLGRHLASDVARVTAAAACVVALVLAVLRGLQGSEHLVAGDLRGFGSELGEDLAQGLWISWPAICAFGFAGAVARWMRLGQVEVAAAAGVPLGWVALPASGLAALLLVAGSAGLGALLPPRPVGGLVWESADGWGAALARDETWDWIEVAAAEHAPALPVAAGGGARVDELPDAGRRALAERRRAEPLWPRLPWLAILAVVSVRLARRSGRARRAAVLAAPGVTWVVWMSARRLGDAFLAGLGVAEAGVEAVALALVVALGAAGEALLRRAG